MLDDLVGVITTLQQRIRDHGPTLRENETRTRMALIDPLLTVLGWDTADPAVVTPAYNVSGRWADYALLGTDGKPAATVEAKKLGESLASHRMQMLNYSNAAGIAYAGLTDGNHWELYEVFAQKPLEERRVLQLSIVDTPTHQCALQLLLLWRPNLASGQLVPASGPILWEGEGTDSEEPTFQPPPDVEWVSLTNFATPKSTKSEPAKPCPGIRFANEVPIETIKNWKDIPSAVVKWLWTNGKLTENTVPVKRGNRYLVNTEPVHPSGHKFSKADQQPVDGTNLFLNTNYSSEDHAKNAKALLEHCGVDPATVQLQVRE